MSNFYIKVYEAFVRNVNNQHFDNYDEDRFGPKVKEPKTYLKEKLKRIIYKNRVSTVDLNYYLPNFLFEFNRYSKQLEFIYDSLNDEQSKKLLIDLISFRILGNTKVKLKTNNLDNKKILQKIKAIENTNDTITPNFLHFQLNKFDLNPLQKNIKLYFTAKGILIDFFLEQYRYNNNGIEICAKKNDVVIDAGGCWGDTALYFADKVGEKGNVFTFEFIPNNLAIFKKNCDLNPTLQNRIKIIDQPLSDVSGKSVYYRDHGPGSRVEFDNFKGAEAGIKTISIDDFVSAKNIERIDFIKMDIEGSELPALEGARQVIKKHKPQLAIAIYHSWDDFVGIPKWILDLDLGYKIYLEHFTIYAEETIIFATVK